MTHSKSPSAEKSDLIASLGRFALEESLAQQTRWKQRGLDLRVNVNIGAWHFLSPTFQKDLRSMIDRNGGACSLTLEIREPDALRDLTQAQKAIEKCRDLGIGVILDDFGTG